MKYSIDEILDMLASKDKSIQQNGVKAATEVKTLKCFMRPPYGEPKNCTWENCAKIVSVRSDDELRRYLTDLFIWISDVNNPGYNVIFERLIRFEYKALIEEHINFLINNKFKVYGLKEILNNPDSSSAGDLE